jgi:hypothetical protein
MKRGPRFGSECGFDIRFNFRFNFRRLCALPSHGAADDRTRRTLTLSLT